MRSSGDRQMRLVREAGLVLVAVVAMPLAQLVTFLPESEVYPARRRIALRQAPELGVA